MTEASDGRRHGFPFKRKTLGMDIKNLHKDQTQRNNPSKTATLSLLWAEALAGHPSVQTRTLLRIAETQLLTQRSPGAVTDLVAIKCRSTCSVAQHRACVWHHSGRWALNMQFFAIAAAPQRFTQRLLLWGSSCFPGKAPALQRMLRWISLTQMLTTDSQAFERVLGQKLSLRPFTKR